MNNFTQILMVLLVFGLPALGKGLAKLQEKAEKRKIEMELERRRIEALRTGRDPNRVSIAPPPQSTAQPTRQPAPASPQRPRLEELAQKRQAQLEELRRRAQARAAGSQTQTQIPTRIPGSSGSTVPTARPRRVQPASRPVPRPVPTAVDPVHQPLRLQPKQIHATAMGDQAQRSSGASIKGRRLKGIIAHQQIDVPESSESSQTQGPHTAAQWRQAIIAAEILGRPLAMRKPDPHDPMAM